MNTELQCIIGTNKTNPFLTVFRDRLNPGFLYVYFGAALIEVVPDDETNFEYKLLIARLYNAKIKAKSIHEAFRVARSTMKRWGDALKSGDPERLIEALSGQGAPRKLTHEIMAFVKVRFLKIYEENHYNYSSIIRDEIKEIFGIEISSESLRPIFNELKKKEMSRGKAGKSGDKQNTIDISNSPQKEIEGIVQADLKVESDIYLEEQKGLEQVENRSIICDSIDSSAGTVDCNNNVLNEDGNSLKLRSEDQEKWDDNPKESIHYGLEKKMFCHHAGALIFSFELSEFSEFIGDDLAKQLLLTVLLGARNIEQTKLLDFNAIKTMIGLATPNLHGQRKNLAEVSTEENIRELLKFNSKLVNANQYDDFYFDPHTKHYTGMEKILKGWCSATRSANKIINMDFIHTAPDGYPVFIEESDNFYDLRERFIKEIDEFRRILGCPEKIMTFIVDRGIFSNDMFETISKNDKVHIITWEKGYKEGEWDDGKINGSFSIFRCRNSSRDIKKFGYDFIYIDRIWEKNQNIRQIIVRATNPRKRTIEVSILTDDVDRIAEQIIELIFSRWVQENDFKYENEHFGINEITTYSKVSYYEIQHLVEDKEAIRGEYKARLKETDTIRRSLKSALLKKETIKSEKRIGELEIEIIELKKNIRWL